MRKWKQRDTIRPCSFLQVSLLCHPSQRSLVSDLPMSLVWICLSSLATCLCPFDTTSIEPRPKDVPLLHNDSLPGLPAPRTSNRLFARQRQCSRRDATSAGLRPPTLQALRFPRTQAGSPAPCDATRYELVPSPIKPVLRFRAVQLAGDALALAPCLPRLGWLCALAFLSNFLTVVCIIAPHL